MKRSVILMGVLFLAVTAGAQSNNSQQLLPVTATVNAAPQVSVQGNVVTTPPNTEAAASAAVTNNSQRRKPNTSRQDKNRSVDHSNEKGVKNNERRQDSGK